MFKCGTYYTKCTFTFLIFFDVWSDVGYNSSVIVDYHGFVYTTLYFYTVEMFIRS